MAPNDSRTRQDTHGDSYAVVGCLAFLFTPIACLVTGVLLEDKQRGAALVMMGVAALALVFSVGSLARHGSATDVASEPSVGTTAAAAASATVEAIVARLRTSPSSNPLCHFVLFGDRPLTGKMSSDDSVLVFPSRAKADDFLESYQHHYVTSRPLSVVPVDSVNNLWGLLHNHAEDPLYRPPYGLIVDFNYGGRPYHAFSIGQLRGFGATGLRAGLAQVL